MVSSKVDIASQALGLIRAEAIDSFDDGSNEADICTLYYDDFIEDLLTRYPWSFTLKKSLFNQTTAPLNEWRYSHIVPAECIRLHAVYTGSEVGASPLLNYDIQSEEGSRRLYSNSKTIYGEYTTRVGEGSFPSYFVHFAIYAFAAMIALPITDDPELEQLMHRLAYGNPSEGEKGGKFAVATGMDMQQKPYDSNASDPFVQARFS